jgi:hypothetical protein
MQEYAVYLDEGAHEAAARTWLDRRLGEDHEAGRPHAYAVYIP